MTNGQACVDCAWYRIRHFNENSLSLDLSDDFEVSMRAMRVWLRAQNKGTIAARRLQDMLRGLRFQRLLVQSAKSEGGIVYRAALQHESGATFGGTADNVSDAIGAAVKRYIDQLVGVPKVETEKRA
jgi:hypothetical protein